MILLIGLSLYNTFDRTGQSQVPGGASSFQEKYYEDVATQFQANGFTNISLEPEGDLITGWITKENSVDSVSINGKDDFSAGAWFPSDAKVIIRYHSFPTNDYDTEDIETSSNQGTESISEESSEIKIDSNVTIPKPLKGNWEQFDQKTNFEFKFHGLNFSIPEYYTVWDDVGEFEKGFYINIDSTEDGSGIAFLASDLDENLDISSYDEAAIDNLLDSGMKPALESLTEKYSDLKVADYTRSMVNEMPVGTVTLVGNNYYMILSCIVCTDLHEVVIVTLSTDIPADYSYANDFYKIIDSAEIVREDDKKDNVSLTTSDQKDTKALGSKTEAEDKTEAGNTKNKGTSLAAKDEMPVMTGSSADIVVEQAQKYGLSEVYDENFGHGTRSKELSDESGGLMLDMIYSSSTNELLQGRIVTMNLVSNDTQKTFIKDMAVALCPSNDQDSVVDWVNNNIGQQTSTTINGNDYSLSIGPTNNLIYNANYNNWETWELSYDD